MDADMEEKLPPAEEKKRLQEEKKKLKSEQKAQKKEAKRRAKELEAQEDRIYDDEGSSGSSLSVFFITLFIILIWLAILALIIKLDIGGVGNNVFKPLLQDVPVVNRILPSDPMQFDSEEEEEYAGYTSLQEAVDQIRRLEMELEEAQSSRQADKERIGLLETEVERLKTFEDNQVEFQRIKEEFYNEVIYAENGPGADEYMKYFESIDPATAENLYKQVVASENAGALVEEYASAYAAMKPKEAAAIFEAMTDNLELAAKILDAMGADDRGKILGVMNPEVAAMLTKIMDPGAQN